MGKDRDEGLLDLGDIIIPLSPRENGFSRVSCELVVGYKCDVLCESVAATIGSQGEENWSKLGRHWFEDEGWTVL